jgi:hypothetical protein
MGTMIRLQWVKYPDGFVVVRDRPPLIGVHGGDFGALALTNGMLLSSGTPAEHQIFDEELSTASWLAPRNPERRTSYIAEGIDQRIFLDLANAGRDNPTESVEQLRAYIEQRVLAFTNQWGMLYTELLDEYQPSLLLDVWCAASHLYRLVDGVQRADISKSLAFSPAEPYVPELRMRWAKLAGDSAPRFFLQPPNLLHFCYAEFLQVVEGGTQMRSCPRCGELFALGKVGQPREYCSDACRIAMHRKRKREREQRASNVVRLRRSGSR